MVINLPGTLGQEPESCSRGDFSSTNIYLGLITVLSISKCNVGSKIIARSKDINQSTTWERQLCHHDSAPRMAGPTNHPLVSRHQVTRWRLVERGEGWSRHWHPDVGGEGGHKLQLRTSVEIWQSDLRLRAPRREIKRIASRSSHVEAPLLLLLHVHRSHLRLLLLHLDIDTRPYWGSRLLLCPLQLLPFRIPGISLLQGEQSGQRQSFLLRQHQLESEKSPHSASSSTSHPLPFLPGNLLGALNLNRCVLAVFKMSFVLLLEAAKLLHLSDLLWHWEFFQLDLKHLLLFLLRKLQSNWPGCSTCSAPLSEHWPWGVVLEGGVLGQKASKAPQLLRTGEHCIGRHILLISVPLVIRLVEIQSPFRWFISPMMLMAFGARRSEDHLVCRVVLTDQGHISWLCWGEISSDLYHALQCDIEISKVKSFELEKKWWKSS